MLKKFIILTSFSLICSASNRQITTIISPRSPSVNAARELVGWEHYVNVYTADTSYGAFSITPEATLTFRPERIGQCLFGDDMIECENILTISGSQRSNRNRMAWLADYFGLPTDYESTVLFRPKINSCLVDLDIFIGWDKYIPGLYFRAHAPLVYSRWDLGMCETFVTTGSNAYDPGYFNADGIPRIQLVDTFIQFIGGEQAPKATGLTFFTLNNAKMSCRSQRLVRLSEIQMVLGWNILHNKDYHLGGNIRVSIPTGNRPTGEFLFEPIIGNGHLWELGGGFSTHIVMWENEATEEQAGLYLDFNVTHMFATDQTRSFDLCHNPNSRYMLAERMSASITQSLRGVVNNVQVPPIAQFQREVTPIANLTTLPIKVSCNVQADLAIMLSYTKGKNTWSFGYELWARSCDSITLCETTPFDSRTWAVKGDSYVFGFENGSNTPVPLSATQSQATINVGKNFPASGATTPEQVATGQRNPNIDNPYPAVSDSDGDEVFVTLLSQPNGTNQINTSIQPKLLTTSTINIDSARTGGFSQKMFSHMNHTITGKELTPYLGFGAEVEFGQHAGCSNVVRLKERPCINTALSYWGVWIKGGIAF